MKRTGGLRRKSRHKLKKSVKERGKVSLSRYFQEFNIGEKVFLKAEPAIQRGMFFIRFKGKAGEILKKRGSCYEIKIKDGKKIKTVISHPIHLKKAS